MLERDGRTARQGSEVIELLGPLRRYARSLTRDEGSADDLVHDALLRAHERRHQFRSSGDLRAWLFSILHNAFVDERRRRAAEAQRESLAANLAEWSAPPEQESRVRLRQVQDAFLMLPEEQRAALHLVAIEGLSYGDAAAALGVPPGTLMSRLGRARAALRAFEAGGAEPLRLAEPDGRGTRPNLRVVGGSDD